MKFIYLLIFLVISGCANIPPEKIATTSSQTLCEKSGADFISAENKELIYKELESRGQTCYHRPAAPYIPPQRKTTNTNCYKVGNQVNCTTR